MDTKIDIISSLMNRANEAESNLIACIMLKPNEIFKFPWLQRTHFSNPKYSEVFDTINNMLLSSKPIDTTTISEELRKKNSDISTMQLVDMMHNHSVSSNASYHADSILKFHTLRRLTDVADNFYLKADRTDIATNDIISGALNDIVDIAQEVDKQNDETIASCIASLEDRTAVSIQKKIDGDDSLLGISCGFSKIDNVIDGLMPGHFWVVGGYTSSGKTFFALNILASVILQKKKSMFVSLEMTSQDIISRLTSILSGVSCREYIKGNITDQKDIDNIQEGFKTIREANLTIRHGSFERIKLAIIKEKMTHGLDVVFIDYLQLLRTGINDANERLEMVSQDLQSLAKEYGVTIIALSQISNEHAKNFQNSDIIGFKGSGAIGASADIAIELVNPDKAPERQEKARNGVPYTVEAAIKKNRHGPIGKVTMEFMPFVGKFIQSIDIDDSKNA